ncbi:hypothetical protein HDU76_011969 [Blyttiomyces sp. JEL0837]|nr:hypothetical protein HDU76_011969 [Blyttiomyces sp. JEL0837]
MVSQEELVSIITALQTKVKKNYVLGDEIADQINAVLQSKLDSEAYTTHETLQSLAEALTVDLRSINDDKHLNVVFTPESQPEDEPIKSMIQDDTADKNKTDEELIAGWPQFFVEKMELYANGITDVRRLDGNVGYLKMVNFMPETKALKAILNGAFTMFKGTHALIIDMRENGGGDGLMSDMLLSYLTDEKLDISEIYWKPTDERIVTSTMDVDGPRYLDKPVYVLTSNDTFSAAEKFAVCVQAIHRAKTVGKTTAGGGYPCRFFKIHNNLRLSVSIGITKCCATGKGWQGIGAPADIECDAKDALDVAHLMAAKDIAAALEAMPASEMTMIKGKLLKETKKVVEDLEKKAAETAAPTPAVDAAAAAPAVEDETCGSKLDHETIKERHENQLPGTYYKLLSNGQYEKTVVMRYKLFGMHVGPKMVFVTSITKEVYDKEMAKKAAAEGKEVAKEE